MKKLLAAIVLGMFALGATAPAVAADKSRDKKMEKKKDTKKKKDSKKKKRKADKS